MCITSCAPSWLRHSVPPWQGDERRYTAQSELGLPFLYHGRRPGPADRAAQPVSAGQAGLMSSPPPTRARPMKSCCRCSRKPPGSSRGRISRWPSPQSASIRATSNSGSGLDAKSAVPGQQFLGPGRLVQPGRPVGCHRAELGDEHRRGGHADHRRLLAGRLRWRANGSVGVAGVAFGGIDADRAGDVQRERLLVGRHLAGRLPGQRGGGRQQQHWPVVLGDLGVLHGGRRPGDDHRAGHRRRRQPGHIVGDNGHGLQRGQPWREHARQRIRRELLQRDLGPDCWQQTGASGTNTFTWTKTPNAHSGSWAQNVAITSYTSGDRKLVTSQQANERYPAP
jgi:hypothetical protein